MLRASCLCGDVVWEVDGRVDTMTHCHCSRCRKTHGALFATYALASLETFRLHGAENIERWVVPGGVARCFCRRCGSVVPGDPIGTLAEIPAGNFESDPGARPVAHIFVASKASFYEISDDLPRFDARPGTDLRAAYPPGYEPPTLPDRAPLDPPGRPRGSCVCGAVTYVLEGQPIRRRFCHCSRCRRQYSAAHAANLLTRADGVLFTRGGEAERTSYKVPEAQHFTTVFCRTCGSKLPHIDRDRQLAIVPTGSLDDDPGLPVLCHIFVGSKAPWFTIADGLPQYEEYPLQ